MLLILFVESLIYNEDICGPVLLYTLHSFSTSTFISCVITFTSSVFTKVHFSSYYNDAFCSLYIVDSKFENKKTAYTI